MNSFTGIFQCHFKPSMLFPCIEAPPPPIKFWRAPPPMFSTPVRNPAYYGAGRSNPLMRSFTQVEWRMGGWSVEGGWGTEWGGGGLLVWVTINKIGLHRGCAPLTMGNPLPFLIQTEPTFWLPKGPNMEFL